MTAAAQPSVVDSVERLRLTITRIVAVVVTCFGSLIAVIGTFQPDWVRWVLLVVAVGSLALTVWAFRVTSLSAVRSLSYLSLLIGVTALVALTVQPAPFGTISGFVFLGITVAVAASEPARPAIIFGSIALIVGVVTISMRSSIPFAASAVLVGVTAFSVYVVVRFRLIIQSARDTAVGVSMLDPLTGASNRRGMELSVERLQRQARAIGHLVGCLILDLDHFKTINDTKGHAEGDRVLVLSAATLRAALRDTDVLVRLGGEEFAVLCVIPAQAELVALGERLRVSIEAMDVSPSITTSVGASILGPSEQDALSRLLRAADSALYEAKASGRNALRLASMA